ncbi:CBO0543 family protein [Desulfosporosinus lacus]|uniref:Uncharacterized protein n=1 Tax=Desulfosporosinus lacus DSM 15449 TaxID=1121420 RepID=A0A1M5ZCB8_9FIRM|nr:hypothetical protein SAMN02746098_03150 [Desulfosporosinus lacus DSM 15449]
MIYIIIRLTNFTIWIIAGYIWGDWRNWSKYYSTILIFSSGNIVYNLVSNEYTLWDYTPTFVNSSVISLVMALTVFPSTVLIFIYHYPNYRSRIIKCIYIFSWSVLYTLIELIFNLLGLIYYEHGWNLKWSFCFNMLTFPLLLLHWRKPPLAWLGIVVLGISLIFLFNIPLRYVE